MSLILSIIIISLYGFLAIGISSLKLLLLTAITLIVSFTGVDLFRRWFQTLLKLIPFLMIYLIFGYAVRINYPLLIQGVIRIVYFILLSVIMIRNIEAYLADYHSYHSSSQNFIKAFFISTLAYIPIFLKEFRQLTAIRGNFLNNLKTTLHNSSNRIERWQNEAADKMRPAFPDYKHMSLKSLIPMLVLGLVLSLYKFRLLKI